MSAPGHFEHAVTPDPGGDQPLRGERYITFVIKFGQEERARQTTYIRELGDSSGVLCSFCTLFAPTVEARVENWLRTPGLLTEGGHEKRDADGGIELIGTCSTDVYADMIDIVYRIVEEVEADMRVALGIASSPSALEPVEVQLERVRQQGLTDRHRGKRVKSSVSRNH